MKTIKGWGKDYRYELDILWEDWESMPGDNTDKLFDGVLEFSLDFINSLLKKTYEEGRQSILDEWEEEQRKLTMGFSYKPKKEKNK
ncbi:MAG: hypothetical protein AABY22_23745 [Nanoarchaeota archaeon]